MFAKSALFALIILTQISCTEIKDKSLSPLAKENLSPYPTSKEIIEKAAVEPAPVDKFIIYSAVLSVIIDDDSKTKTLGLIEPTELLVYRSETISPSGLDQIENNPEIPKSLFRNFIERNQKTERLEDGYDVLAPIQSISGSSDLTKFYNQAKRKYPETKVSVGLSNIGIDEDYSKALIYVEYFHPDKKLMKFYLGLSIVNPENSGSKSKIYNFSGYKIYLVN